MTEERPIRALRVVEIGDLGEVAGKLLADAGADLVRVEPPGGAETRRVGPFVGDRPATEGSLRFGYFNTSKRGVTLDVATPAGRELWWRLVAGAEVVIDAAGHGVLDAIDAGWEACLARAGESPAVWCSVTPFGREGPWADWVVNDLVQIALGGPMMSTGYDDHELPPIRGGFDHSHWISGEYATVGILAAVLACEVGATAAPELVDVSIHEAVSCTTEGAFPNWEYRRQIVQRQTGRHSAPLPTPEVQYPTADGRYVHVMGGGMPRDDRNLEAMLAWLDEHGAAEDLHDPKYRDAIFTPPNPPAPERLRFAEAIQRFAGMITAEEAYRGGQALHLPWGVVRRPEENLDDPHWTDRDTFSEVEVPGHEGRARVPVAPYRFEDASRAVQRRAPLLGEHNHEVYVAELGLSSAELLALSKSGAV